MCINLIGIQSHAIDTGDGQRWASTFTEHGVFRSPTYPEPLRGREQLAEFAAGFAVHNPGAHHITANPCIDQRLGTDACHAKANLLIVRTNHEANVRIDRVTTVHDHLIREHDNLRVAERVVTRH